MPRPILNLPITAHRGRGSGSGGKRKKLQDIGRNIYASIGHDTRFRKFQRMYRDDRVAFTYDCVPKLRDTFAPYQEEILANYDMGHRRQAIRAPHGSGKTLVAALLVHHMLLTTEEDATVPTLASVWRQLDKYLWPEIHKVSKFLDWERIGRDPYTRDELMVHSIRTNGGISESFAVASGQAALIEGAHGSRLFYIFDESKTIEDAMWDAAEGAFATEGTTTLAGTGFGECYWLAISTPGDALGRFYAIHSRKAGYEDWLVRHITKDESLAAGRISQEWVDARKKQWGEHSAVYIRRVLANFATSEAEGVIPLSWIEAAMDRYRIWREGGSRGEGLGLRKLGVDMARMGVDKTAFAERVGDTVEKLHVYAQQKVPVSAGYLKPLALKSAEVMIEMDSGLGASVYDILSTEMDPFNPNMNLIPVYMMAGTSYMDKTNTFRFNSTRSAAWWNLRERLDPDNDSNIMLPDDDELLGDLAAPQYKIQYWHNWLTIFVEPKDNLKKPDRLGRSTDRGDAVVLAFWDDPGGGGGVVF